MSLSDEGKQFIERTIIPGNLRLGVKQFAESVVHSPWDTPFDFVPKHYASFHYQRGKEEERGEDHSCRWDRGNEI
jgi:hypothetical protein